MPVVLRQLILEQLDELAEKVTAFQQLVGAYPDGVWGPETQSAWDRFVRRYKPNLEGASIDNVIDEWESYGDKLRKVNGVFTFYRPDVSGAIQFVKDLKAFSGPEEESAPDVYKPASGSRKLKGYIIGDSISVGPFGVELERELERAGYDVFRAAVGGSAASGWVVDKPFKNSAVNLTTVTSNGTYDFGIICLGTNDSANAARAVYENPGRVTMPALTSAFARNINSIATHVGAPINFWVGPPALAGSGDTKWWIRSAADAMYDAAMPTFIGNTYDSRWVSPGSDGVHVYGAEATRWALDVARNVTKQLESQ